ncbi:MAG: matrixin family metalloprotease [Candidatus Riflebacteria bacterium]|nr:matrixin family metalloprotease [Candidatus Riflebacteria bacterium]
MTWWSLSGGRWRVVASAALLVWCAVGPAGAYVFEVTDNGVPIFWPDLKQQSAAPLRFTFNDRGPSLLGGPLRTNGALKQSLDLSFGRWTQVPSASVRFQPAIVSGHQGLGNDGVNLVVFTSVNPMDFTGPDGPYIVGLTTTSFVPSTGVMVDADIQFNDTSPVFTLSLTEQTGRTDPGARGSYFINLEDVATHEIGHALGLDHTGVKGATMYFAAADGGKNLGTDDVAGISALYPTSGFAATTGVVSGRVLGPGPVFGAHVVAVDTATGRPAVSGITGRDGRYRIEGLAPGSYVLVAEPLKPNALGTFYEQAAASFYLGLLATTSSAPPTVVVVRAGAETGGNDIRVDQRRVDSANPDSLATAIRLDAGQAVSRSLPPGSRSHPADYFSFEASPGSTLTINVTSHRLWVPVNPQIEILDSALRVLSGPSSDASPYSPVDLDDQVIFRPPNPGNQMYWIRVRTSDVSYDSFPDSRSVKEGESLYILSMRRTRTNHPPRITASQALTQVTTSEAGGGRPGVWALDLTDLGADDEDSIDTLTWTATDVPTDLCGVDLASLAAKPAVLRILPRPYRSGSGTFNLMLIDSDGASAVQPVRVRVLPVHDAPRADAVQGVGSPGGGPRAIQLDASASRAAPEGDNAQADQGVAYAWTQLAGPAPVSLTGQLSPLCRIVARDAGRYRFRVHVTQTHAPTPLTSDSTVEFTVENVPPHVEVVAPPVALMAQRVMVRGALSTDANEELTTAAFSLTGVSPGAASIAVTREATSTFSLTAPTVPGTYTFQLAATDSGFLQGDGSRSGRLTGATTFTVEVRGADDLPPTADAGPGRVVNPGDLVVLDGRESRSPAGEPLTYSWSIVAGAPAAVVLTNPETVQPNFFAPGAAGVYRFRLIARGTRTGLSSPPSICEIRVIPTRGDNRYPPVARGRVLSPAGDPSPGELVILDANASQDPEGAVLRVRWTQVHGPAVTLSSVTGSTPSFVPPATGTYRFRLDVSDGQLDARPVEVEVRASPYGAVAPSVVVTAVQPLIPLTAKAPGEEARFVVDGTTATANAIQLTASLSPPTPVREFLWEELVGPRVPWEESEDGARITFVPRQVRVHTFRVTAVDLHGRALRCLTHVLVDRPDSHIPRAAVTAPGPPTTLVRPMAARPSFVPPTDGLYAFRLRVDNQRDGTLSAPSEGSVAVQVTRPQPATTSSTGSSSASGKSGGTTTIGCSRSRSGGLEADDAGGVILFVPFLAALAIKRRGRGGAT